MNGKYVMTMIILSLLLTISISINIFNFIIIQDLNETIDMHINTKNVCKQKLDSLRTEFEEYRKEYFKNK